MKAYRLNCVCLCGGFGQPLSNWITEDKHLLVTCYCVACEKQFNVIFPLSMLYKNCPKRTITPAKLNEVVTAEIARIVNEPGKPLQPPLRVNHDEEDKIIGHALGVSMEAE